MRVDELTLYNDYYVDKDDLGIDKREVIPETVGQFTGLTDKNGKMIFEGDKVRLITMDKIGYVTFLQQELGYVVVLEKTDIRLGHRNTGSDYMSDYDVEVIGTIYNKEKIND